MKKINIAEKSFNPFDLIGQKWMLISAGTEDKWNTMTASWGAVGVMWGKPSATCYIRKMCIRDRGKAALVHLIHVTARLGAHLVQRITVAVLEHGQGEILARIYKLLGEAALANIAGRTRLAPHNAYGSPDVYKRQG